MTDVDTTKWSDLITTVKEARVLDRNTIVIYFRDFIPEDIIRFFSGALHLAIIDQHDGKNIKYSNPIIFLDKKSNNAFYCSD